MTDIKRNGISTVFFKFIAVLLICTGISASQSAKAQITINNTPACLYLLTITAGLTLSAFPRAVPHGYKIIRRSHPPTKIFKPGDTYQIRYAIAADPPNKFKGCMDIGTHDLTLAATLKGKSSGDLSIHNSSQLNGYPGNDRSQPIAEAAKIVGRLRVNRFRYNKVKWTTATFTVPNFDAQVGQTNLYDVVMWVCPPNTGALNCHGHTITVQNQASSGWKIEKPRPRIRALGGENRVPANRPIPLATKVSQLRGWAHHAGQGPKLQLIYLTGPSGTTNSVVDDADVPPLGAGNSTSMNLNTQPLAPGIHSFKACLTRLKDGNNWPVRDLCSGFITLHVAAARTLPPPQPVTPAAPACTGGRIKNVQGRCVCPTGTRWNAKANRCTRPVPACTGGKIRSASGRCVCPTGLVEIRGNCARIQGVPTPGVKIPGLTKQPTIRCAGGTVTNNTCLCPRGWSRRTLQKNTYVCRPPAKRPAPGASQTRPLTKGPSSSRPAQVRKPGSGRMQCLGGQVKGALCWCGIGRFPKKIGNNVYRCQ